MRKFLLLSTMLIAIPSLFAQYTTPGTSVNWTFEDLVANSGGAVTNQISHYQINENLTIAATDTLKILNNITIKAMEDVEITIQGVLVANPANGMASITAIDPLAFYRTIRFENSNASILKNCIIEYGNGLEVVESDMLIDGCIIRYNTDDYNSSAIDLFQSNPTIQNCEIYENQSAAIASGANAECAPLIQNNYIYSNVMSNANKPQINLGTSGVDTIKIISNTIAGEFEMAGGIAISTLAGGNVQCVIDTNVISNNRYGIAMIGSNISSIICRNTIDGNNIQNEPMLGGSGINFYGSNTNTSLVYKNMISNNLWGVTIQYEAMPNLGEITSDSTCIGLNEFTNNGNSGEIFALYNNTPNDIYAENNYWGSYNLDTVEMHIFHQTDSAALGFVDYLPITPEPEPPSMIFDNEMEGLIIYPNPCSDEIQIQLPLDIEETTQLSLKIYNSQGQLVKSVSVQSPREMLTLKTTNLARGVYFVKLSSSASQTIRKLIKN